MNQENTSQATILKWVIHFPSHDEALVNPLVAEINTEFLNKPPVVRDMGLLKGYNKYPNRKALKYTHKYKGCSLYP